MTVGYFLLIFAYRDLRNSLMLHLVCVLTQCFQQYLSWPHLNSGVTLIVDSTRRPAQRRYTYQNPRARDQRQTADVS